MSDDSQLVLPPSFIAVFVPPGRVKPTESRLFIAERYEFCEDLAQALAEQAQERAFALGVPVDEVLQRMQHGLVQEGAGVSGAEGQWVGLRLAELLA